jgi:hypothetical protein
MGETDQVLKEEGPVFCCRKGGGGEGKRGDG